MDIILASASPRRRQLMTQYGFQFSVQPAEVEETMPPHLTVGEITLYNAKKKALAIAHERPDSLVIGVDTLVAFDGMILGKPATLDEAFLMLSRLSGRVHEVFSGVWAVRRLTSCARALVEVSRVKFRDFDEAQIRNYLARIDPMDKAGAYAAQDESPDTIVEQIEGSRTNVIGLPMEALTRMLDQGF